MVTVEVAGGWLSSTLLASLRIAASTMFVPIFGVSSVPNLVRIVWLVTLAACLMAALPASPPQMPTDALGLAIASVGEAVIGASLGFGLLAAYSATQVAGRVLDIQIGFGVASILNPSTRVPSSLLGAVFGMGGLMVFLAMDGHHVLIQALTLSLQTYPPGRLALAPDLSGLLSQCSAMFSFGLALAAPVMFALLLADIAMALMARSMPQLNVFVLSFSVKILLGLLGLAFSVRFSEGVLQALFSGTFRFWDHIAGGSG